MAKIKFRQQEAKNKQKILHDIYMYNQFSMPNIAITPMS